MDTQGLTMSSTHTNTQQQTMSTPMTLDAENQNVSSVSHTLPDVQNVNISNESNNTTESQKQMSRLDGVKLNITATAALDVLNAAVDKFPQKLAVASLKQPAEFLAPIFDPDTILSDNDHKPPYLRWSFTQLRRASRLLAASFAARGVRPGMTVAAMVHGSVEFHIILYATLLLRCRFSPINYTAAKNTVEIQHIFTLLDAQVLIVPDLDTLQTLQDSSSEILDRFLLRAVLTKPQEQTSPSPAETIEDLILSAHHFSDDAKDISQYENVETSPDDNVIILFTSGTSSLPKACPLTNRNLCSLAHVFAKGPTGGPQAVFCSHLPLYHIAGAISCAWNPLTSGAAIVHPSPSFQAGASFEAIRQEHVTFMVLVPTMVGLMLDDPALPPPGDMSIKTITLGASTILYTDVEKCYKYLGAKQVITSYGMTEGLMMTRGYLPREPTHAALNGIQQICAGARIKICEPNSRTLVPRGEPGEVHQGGICTIRGYLGKESDAFYEDEDGVWCVTGDQAIMHPEGGIQVTGRYKDLIIRGGVNISPQAIEDVIARTQDVEAHVVGMPDSLAGEVPVAIVRKAHLERVSLQKMRASLVKELGSRFVLEKFLTIEELGFEDFPRTSTGKIRKVELQAKVKQYAQMLESKSRMHSSNAAPTDKSILSQLLQVLSDVTGLAEADLSPDTPVQELADSLVLSRYTSQVKQNLGQPFSLKDVSEHATLREQADLLEVRSQSDGKNADLVTSRSGPPSEHDIVYAQGDADIALRTRLICEQTLQDIGFAWDDVSDVVIPSQWLQSWVKSRETSDRFRVAYIATEGDVEALRAAIAEVLSHHDSLRAISIPRESSDIQVILRCNDKLLDKVINVRDQPIPTKGDVERLIPGDFGLAHGLLRVEIAHVEETNTAGACFMMLHTTFDAISLDMMLKDLNLVMNNIKVTQHVPYKLWADHLCNQQGSVHAQTSIRHNVRRLQGVATKTAALWPPQRTAVWQRGCDRGLHVTTDGRIAQPGEPNLRPLLDGPPEQCVGSAGFKREHCLRDIHALTVQHRVPPQILIKAAFVLMQTEQTGQSDALFTQTFAMRDKWPFVDAWVSSRLPLPLEITGPTLVRIAEVVPVDTGATILDWLMHLRDEQEELITHAQAPYRDVFDHLNGTAATSASPSPLHTPASISRTATPILLTPPHDDDPVTLEYRRKRPSPGLDLDEESVSEFKRLRPMVTPATATPAAPTPTPLTAPPAFANEAQLPQPLRDGDIMESIRKRINFQWLPIFSSDKGVKPQVKVLSSSHFNEVGLAVKCGLLADHQTVWIRMQWDDGNIRASEAKAWIDRMIGLVEILGKQENWSRRMVDVLG